jgi:hypothetical protein
VLYRVNPHVLLETKGCRPSGRISALINIESIQIGARAHFIANVHISQYLRSSSLPSQTQFIFLISENPSLLVGSWYWSRNVLNSSLARAGCLGWRDRRSECYTSDPSGVLTWSALSCGCRNARYRLLCHASSSEAVKTKHLGQYSVQRTSTHANKCT